MHVTTGEACFYQYNHISETLFYITETCGDRGMFECQNHQCIALAHRCDDIRDCHDGSDEYRCGQYTRRGSYTFKPMLAVASIKWETCINQTNCTK